MLDRGDPTLEVCAPVRDGTIAGDLKGYNDAVYRQEAGSRLRLATGVLGSGIGVAAAIWGGIVTYVAKAPLALLGDIAARRIWGAPEMDRVRAGALLAEAERAFAQ